MSSELQQIQNEVARSADLNELTMVNTLAIVLNSADQQVIDVKTRYEQLKMCNEPMSYDEIASMCEGMTGQRGDPVTYSTVKQEFERRGWSTLGKTAAQLGIQLVGRGGQNRLYFPPQQVREFAISQQQLILRKKDELIAAYNVFCKKAAIFLNLKCETFEALEVGEAALLQRFIVEMINRSMSPKTGVSYTADLLKTIADQQNQLIENNKRLIAIAESLQKAEAQVGMSHSYLTATSSGYYAINGRLSTARRRLDDGTISHWMLLQKAIELGYGQEQLAWEEWEGAEFTEGNYSRIQVKEPAQEYPEWAYPRNVWESFGYARGGE